jgi:hypothetical protein
VLLALVAGLAGCGGLTLMSVWRDRDVVIDGVPAEWHGANTWVENPNVAVAVMNDDDYLYLCFSTPLRAIAAEVIHRGLTVWFDPAGKSNRVFGIRCPVGFSVPSAGVGAPGGTPEPDRMRGAPRDSAGSGAAFGEMHAEELQHSVGTVEVIGPGKGDSLRLEASEVSGIQVMIGYYSGRFVYELEVPLRQGPGRPYAIGYQSGGRISLGFETPATAREAFGSEMAGRMPRPGSGGSEPGGDGDDGWGGEPEGEGGGFGGAGQGGGPGGPPGGMERGGPRGSEERLQVWGTVHLATK